MLPFTFDPVHDVTNGDSFLIEPLRSHAASQHDALLQVQQAQLDYEEEAANENDSRNHFDDSEGSMSHSSFGDQTQAVHIYRLGHLAIFGHLDWRTYNTALRDAIQISRITRHQCVGFHYLQARPTGHHEGEEAIILQHIDDIAVGSLEKLVIVDIVYHTNSLSSGIPVSPTTVREVYKLPHLLARSHLLTLRTR